jgi:hypothetical protein
MIAAGQDRAAGVDGGRAEPRACSRALAAGGITARFVGGCVRNAVLGRRSTISISPSTGLPNRSCVRWRRPASRRCRPASGTAR